MKTTWQLAFLLKRAGFSERTLSSLLNTLARSWKRSLPGQAAGSTQALAYDTLKRRGLKLLRSSAYPEAGAVSLGLAGASHLPPVRGSMSWQLLPPQELAAKRGLSYTGYPVELTYLQSHGEGGGRFFRAYADMLNRIEEAGKRHGMNVVPFLHPGREMANPLTGERWDALKMWARLSPRLGGFTHFFGRAPYVAGRPRGSARWYGLTPSFRERMIREHERWPSGIFARFPEKAPVGYLKDPYDWSSFEG